MAQKNMTEKRFLDLTNTIGNMALHCHPGGKNSASVPLANPQDLFRIIYLVQQPDEDRFEQIYAIMESFDYNSIAKVVVGVMKYECDSHGNELAWQDFLFKKAKERKEAWDPFDTGIYLGLIWSIPFCQGNAGERWDVVQKMFRQLLFLRCTADEEHLKLFREALANLFVTLSKHDQSWTINIKEMAREIIARQDYGYQKNSLAMILMDQLSYQLFKVMHARSRFLVMAMLQEQDMVSPRGEDARRVGKLVSEIAPSLKPEK